MTGTVCITRLSDVALVESSVAENCEMCGIHFETENK